MVYTTVRNNGCEGIAESRYRNLANQNRLKKGKKLRTIDANYSRLMRNLYHNMYKHLITTLTKMLNSEGGVVLVSILPTELIISKGMDELRFIHYIELPLSS